MKKREIFLSYGQQWISDEDVEPVISTLKSPFLTQGPKLRNLKKK
jgi:hypothetical protein